MFDPKKRFFDPASVFSTFEPTGHDIPQYIISFQNLSHVDHSREASIQETNRPITKEKGDLCTTVMRSECLGSLISGD